MGKPYDSELASLPRTYEWAQTADIKQLTTALRRMSTLPLVAIGSGGSFTTAIFAADCHTYFSRRISKAITPLELVAGSPEKGASYLIASAAGKNRDILAAFQHVVHAEPASVTILCTSAGSPLAEAARRYAWVDLIEYEIPTGKDGFVATNSLFASCIMLARAFSEAVRIEFSLPTSFDELAIRDIDASTGPMPQKLNSVLEREQLLVMHDLATRAAALDIESKFSEAALGPVQVCDIRNFAHGRHHWLAKRGDSTGVLVLHGEASSALVHRTTRLLPKTIRVADLVIPGNRVVAGVSAILAGLHTVGAAGRLRGIDPGRPGVPPFGSRIYNLPAFSGTKRQAAGISPSAEHAIRRKTGLTAAERERLGLADFWSNAHSNFCITLGNASFGAVVFDYDGTLCDPASRFGNTPSDMAKALTGLLSRGILIGIATGRGGSVREALVDQISGPSCQENVIIGYHNGTEIAALSDASQPPEDSELSEALTPVWAMLSNDPRTKKLALLRRSAGQITVRPNDGAEDIVWPVVKHYAAVCRVPVVRSTHSFDLLAPGVGKRRLVSAVRERIRSSSCNAILVIGDQGEWPGNDYELLSEPYSLSVDQVSPDPTTCWNLLPLGIRGAQGVMWYLKQFRFLKRGFTFKTTLIR